MILSTNKDYLSYSLIEEKFHSKSLKNYKDYFLKFLKTLINCKSCRISETVPSCFNNS